MYTLRLRPFDADLLLTPQWEGPPLLKWGLLLLVCGVPLALVVWLYRYELRLVPRLTALGLLGLRVVALVLILFLACLQPIYARSKTDGLPGRVLIAVDRSDSMDVADAQRPAVDKLRLARALKLARDLASDAQLAAWIADYEQKREPQWAGRDENRAAHDKVCARVDQLTRSQAAERVLGDEGVRLLATLGAKHQVELLGFNRESWDLKSDQLAELFHKPQAAGPVKKEGDQKKPDPMAGASASAFTDLRLPLALAQERSGPGQGKVLGVVLLTDGQHNAGDPPNKLARELGQRGLPVYPVALGARKPPPDLAIVSLRCAPSTVFKDVDANLDVRFKVTGLPAGDYVVEVRRAGAENKLLAQRTVLHDGKDRDYSERFKLRMDEVGTQTLVASVRPADPQVKETRTDNNSRATSVNVADDTAKVLLIDGEARWEYHYLASALKRDRTMKLTSVVFEQPRLDENLTPEDLEKMGSPRQRLPEGRDALGDYQCIILGDVSPAQLPLAERQRLEKYVADGGGTLVVLAGKRFMPLAYPEAEAGGDSDPLRKLLPVESPRVVAPEEGFPLTLTQAGRETSFLELDPDGGRSAERWAQMPPHFWGVVGRAKPGATPLAWVTEGGAANKAGPERERESALIARHNYGFGRVLYVGLDSTWRWRFKVGDTYHHRFWGQAIRWAAADKPLVTGNAYVRLGTPQPVYRQGQEVELTVRLNDEAGPLKPDLLAAARVLRLDGGKEQAVALVTLARRPGQPRVLTGTLRDLPPGQYGVELVIPDLADKLLTPEEPKSERAGKPLRASFTLLPPDSREAVDLETKWPLLEDLASASGGRVFTPEDAGELANLLANETVQHTEHREQRLWQSWVMLALVVLLLTLEWGARKWAGLP
jgi:hypothetical protein